MATKNEIMAWVDSAVAMRLEAFRKIVPNIAEEAAPLVVRFGNRFAKVCQHNGTGLSVWAFVDIANGDIYKPASWAAPAKHVRGNIAKGLEGIGPYGPAYLR